MADFAAARLNMVESQIRPNKVTDPRVIAAFEGLPREDFLPEALRAIAYSDRSLKVGAGRYILDPMVLARLVQAADPLASDIVLDIACGSGYSTAVLARLAATVVAVESEPRLVELANATLTELEVDSAVVVEGSLAAGRADQGPYDAILINGMVDRVPEVLTEQLADGGRLVTVQRDAEGIGRAMLYRRQGNHVTHISLFDATVPLLQEFVVERGFVF